MPRSQEVPPKKIQFQKAAARRLQRKLAPLNPTGRRNENKGENIAKYRSAGTAVGANESLTKRKFTS